MSATMRTRRGGSDEHSLGCHIMSSRSRSRVGIFPVALQGHVISIHLFSVGGIRSSVRSNDGIDGTGFNGQGQGAVGGCLPIGVTASGEIVFPFTCKAFIERLRANRGAETCPPMKGRGSSLPPVCPTAPTASKELAFVVRLRELTRSASIQLNERVRLQSPTKAIT
jgi:hypothetical protein